MRADSLGFVNTREQCTLNIIEIIKDDCEIFRWSYLFHPRNGLPPSPSAQSAYPPKILNFERIGQCGENHILKMYKILLENTLMWHVKLFILPACWLISVTLSLRKLKQTKYHEFTASLGYIASSRPTGLRVRPYLKNKINKNGHLKEYFINSVALLCLQGTKW